MFVEIFVAAMAAAIGWKIGELVFDWFHDFIVDAPEGVKKIRKYQKYRNRKNRAV